MKITKALCCAITGLLVPALFSGCFGGNGDNGGNGGNGGGNIPVGPIDDGDLTFTDDGDIVYDGVELKMWSVTTGDDADVQDSIIAKFNELYDGMIKVTTTHTSRYDLETLITTTMQFDRANAPDVFFSHGSRAGEYVDKGWLLPIEPYMEKAGLTVDKDDYVEALTAAASVNGHLYGLPQDVHSAMVVYRADILEKNNLKVPTNYNELVATCEAAMDLAKAGNLWIRGENTSGVPATEWRKAPVAVTYEPFPIAYGDMWVHEFLGFTAAAQNGATFVAADGKPAWNTDEAATGLQVLRDFVMPSDSSVNKYALTKEYGSEYDVGNAPMRRGDCIFKLLGPWEYAKDLTEYGRMLSDDGGADNIDTMALSNLFATDNTKEYANKVKGEGHAFMLMETVTSRTKQCAAMVFADWMVNNAGVDWAKRGHLPSLKSVENSSEYRGDPAYTSYISKWGSCDDYIVMPSTAHYSYVDKYFKDSVQQAMSSQFKNSTIKSILQQKYDDCVSYIELYA